MKNNAYSVTTYRTKCGEAGYLVECADGSVDCIRAYCGSCFVTCDGCPAKDYCELWEPEEIRATHMVCGWEEAAALLDKWRCDE